MAYDGLDSHFPTTNRLKQSGICASPKKASINGHLKIWFVLEFVVFILESANEKF